MEKDLKNEVQKMISSTTDQKYDATMNDGSTGSDSSTTDQKGDDVAMNPAGAKMEESHQKEGGDDDVALSDSSNKRKLERILAIGPSETETTSAVTSSKKRYGSPPPGNVHTMKLKAGQDVVDAIYQISAACDHRRFVSIVSATGSVSDVVIRDQYGSYKRMKNSYMTSLSKLCLGSEDGHPTRKNARCSISFHDQYGNNFESIDMGRLIAAGPVEIIADTSKELKKEKKSVGLSTVAAAPAPNIKLDLEKDVKEIDTSGKLVEKQTIRLSPTTPPVADGLIIPTASSTANDQDLKSPSVEDT